MAPIKFEENIKEKLEKRTIQPSIQAWNTLSDKLDVDTKKSSIRKIWWLGIAASLVGILFTVNVFFKTSETKNQIPVIVDTEAKEVELFENNKHADPEEVLVLVEEAKVAVQNIDERDKALSVNKKKTHILKSQKTKNASLAQVDNNKEPDVISNTIITKKLGAKMAVGQLEISYSETEIDVLLLKAQQHISKTANSNTYAIDAKALLQDVEEDLEESFRDKVFETIKTNYKKVKTAVAERND